LIEILRVAFEIATVECDLEKRKSKYKLPLDFNTSIFNSLSLRVKVSVSAGETVLLFVGDSERMEMIIAGPTLTELAEAEHHQTSPSKVIAGPSVWMMLENHAPDRLTWKDVGQGFKEVNLNENVPTNQPHNHPPSPLNSSNHSINDSPLNSSNHSEIGPSTPKTPSVLNSRKQHTITTSFFSQSHSPLADSNAWMRKFVPIPVVRFNGVVVPELRKITTMFVQLHGEFSMNNDSFQKLQQATLIILACLRNYNGELRQAIVDDKGAVQIGLFGVPFLSTDINAKCAILCAMMIVDELRTKLNMKCSIGLATGRAYLGNCGSIDRCEYVALGE